MSRSARISCLLGAAVLLGLLIAGPAAADAFHVKLTNGNEFVTKYEPIPAHYDENKVLIMTASGNIISLAKEDIESVEHDVEFKGFGRLIDTTTIEVGWAANDALSPEQIQEDIGGVFPGLSEGLMQQQMQQMMQPPPTVYNTQQFAEPGATSGMPVSFATSGMVPMGGSTPPR